MSDTIFGLKVNDKEYLLDITAIGAADNHALRKELGFGWQKLWAAMQEEPELDLIAGLIWMCRRHNGEPGVQFSTVMSTINYKTEIEIFEPEDQEKV